MMSEYGNQIKAFFHFMFKHFFEIEFGVRVAIELLICVVFVFILSKICYKFIGKIKNSTAFINRELVGPLRVRFFEKLAFSTNNPNWQEKANKIKDAFKNNNSGSKVKNDKNSHTNKWIIVYLLLIAWIIGFHYFGEEKRSNYEVFFWGENTILKIEEWTINNFFDADENNIECFFHDKIEVN